MKTYDDLYNSICSFGNLLKASRKARLGKRGNTNVAKFEFNLETELIELRHELLNLTYKPGAYKEFYIYEPKKRMISAAPYRDRVVHHALYNIIEPLFENKFIFDSYANRKNKGTHRAIERFQEYSRKCRYVLKCDIKKYFPSIDHQILKSEVRRTIKCKNTLWLIDTIIDNSNSQESSIEYFDTDNLFTPFERRKGLPIGNLTSQFFANVYLNCFDHFIKENLRCNNYIRYVDDFVVFANSKSVLRVVQKSIENYLNKLRLKVHPNKTKIFPVSVGISFLGHRIFPEFRLLKKENIKRFRKRIRQLQLLYAYGNINIQKLKQSIISWIAHAKFSNTYRLRKKILSECVFQKG